MQRKEAVGVSSTYLKRAGQIVCSYTFYHQGENVFSVAKLAAWTGSKGFLLHSWPGDTAQVCSAESRVVVKDPHSLLSPSRSS